MKVKNILIILFLAFSLIILFCCMPTTPRPELEPSLITVSYKMPNVRALENYPELQGKEGIAISVVPENFYKVKRTRVKCDWIGTSLEKLLGLKEEDLKWDNKTYYKVIDTPYYEVKPDILIFKIKIYNHLDRVLRLAGTVVAFQVDGKMIHLAKKNYQEFIDGFIIPRQEAEYQIVGPPIYTLPDQCNVALLLYDIVTQTDEAGNVMKKSNFEWYFIYNIEVKSEPAMENVKDMHMTRSEARDMEKRRQ